MDYKRGKITRIDLTVLSTDSIVAGERLPVRKYVERTARKALRQALAAMDPSIFETTSISSRSAHDASDGSSDRKDSVPIRIHASEPTAHFSQLYLLIVAHTSTGFKIGHDILLENLKSHKKDKKKNKNVKENRQQHSQGAGQQYSELSRVSEMIDQCVEGFLAEVSDGLVPEISQPPHAVPKKRSLFDAHMRDQIVVFEALGQLDRNPITPTTQEDERHWTLHTRTAQWVCQRMLSSKQGG